MSNNINKGIKNISYSIIGQFISLALGIVIPRLVIVSYGSEVNGLLSSIGQVLTYLALLEVGIGAATCQALYKPISERDHDRINSILSATNIYYTRIGYIYLSLVVLVAIIFPFIINTTLNYWLIFTLVLVQGMPGVISFFFQRKLRTLMEAEGDNYVLTNLGTVTNMLTSILKIVLLTLNVNIILIQVIYCFANLGQMIFITAYVRKHYPWLNLKHTPDFSALKSKNAAFLHQICGIVTSSTDVMILSIFCDLKAASIYAVYNMIFNLVYNILGSITSGTAFMLGQEFYKDRDRYCKIINAYETYYVALTSGLMFVVYVLISPFLKLYTAGADINYINNSFPLLFFLVKVLESYRNAAVITASVSGHFEGTKWHAIIESIINLSVSVIAVQKYGMTGVLFGTIVAFLFRDCIALIYSNRVILKRSVMPSIRRILINSVTIVIMFFVSQRVYWYANDYLQLALKAVPLTIVSLLIFLAINTICDMQSYSLAKELFLPRIYKRFFKKG